MKNTKFFCHLTIHFKIYNHSNFGQVSSLRLANFKVHRNNMFLGQWVQPKKMNISSLGPKLFYGFRKMLNSFAISPSTSRSTITAILTKIALSVWLYSIFKIEICNIFFEQWANLSTFSLSTPMYITLVSCLFIVLLYCGIFLHSFHQDLYVLFSLDY